MSLLNVACCEPGRPWPMGACLCSIRGRSGMNLTVFAPHAHSIVLCLFDDIGTQETARWRLPTQDDGVWNGFVPGVTVGQRYGLRADGPWQPDSGHRYNPAKLLLDPWARALAGPLDALALEAGHQDNAPDQPDPGDNAQRMPKSLVIDTEAELRAGAAITPGPATDWSHTLLYEAQVKSLTQLHPDIAPALRGRYAAVASPPMLAHYQRLGITALCLLPVHLRVSEAHLLERGLCNHWGYNTLSHFIPDPRFAGAGADAAAVRTEFRQLVDTLHRHGIEVLLDVVYNHTAEGHALGPTLSWRGLDNASWYALDAQGKHLDPSGCGNTLNMGQPRVLQFILDSLRWWVQAYGVDGFRFDLAVALGRAPELGHNFNPRAAFFAALAQDPVLTRVKLIAEPWDLGPHGYRNGQFGPGWHEWNDRYRDTLRAWWLGHACTRGQFARHLSGSSDQYQRSERAPATSINLVTSHDGFTLADLTAYLHKHNQANGEDNRDGHSHNLSANGGQEGPSSDPSILALRARWRRALLATLLLSQGTPQLLAGDELGHSQQGNNNAYCQDNPITWLDWRTADAELLRFVAALSQLRRHYPGLRHPQWFSGAAAAGQRWSDIEWRKADGQAPQGSEWDQPNGHLLACVISVGEDGGAARERLLLVFQADDRSASVTLPAGPWKLLLDSARGWVASADEPPRDVIRYVEAGPGTVLLLAQSLPQDLFPAS